MIDSRAFRTTLGRFATGVTVVSMQEGEARHGITVNAFLSLSLDPPLVGVSIDRSAHAHGALLASERYGVSVLRADQEAVSNHFAGRPDSEVAAPFESLDGFPVIVGAVAQLVCRIVDRYDTGDHTLFVGEVETLLHREGQPLLYFGGDYRRVGPVT
jgi:flavin reductase (DIM6/NTAB) family NADH-FMN oxidoreductase RutF